MKTAYSVIVAVNNRFPVVDNFLHHLDSLVGSRPCEVILVADGPQDVDVVELLKKVQEQPQYEVIWLDKRYGYGIANNIGVEHACHEMLVFIGTDVFPDPGSMELLLETVLGNDGEAIAQGLTLYPQTGRIQSTGHIFGHYINRHALENRLLKDVDIPPVMIRQALSSTFYAMRKSLFIKLGMFDKFYYNAWEGMELTLKAGQHGVKCLCVKDAIAYHVRGGGRKDIYVDEEQQSALFWSRWHNFIRNDHIDILAEQLNQEDLAKRYVAVIVNQYRTWEETFERLELRCEEVVPYYPCSPGRYTFETELPNAILQYPGSLIFACDNFQDVFANAYAMKRREGRGDIVLDLSGNVVRMQ